MAALVLLWAVGPGGALAQSPSSGPVQEQPSSQLQPPHLVAEDKPAGPPGEAPPADPWSSPDIVAPRMDARPLHRNLEPRRVPATSSPATRGPNSPLRTTAALGGVVGVILLLAWGYRAVASRAGRLPLTLRNKRPALIEVVSRAALAPRQSLCLVRIGPRLVLLGVTPDAVRPLDVIHDPDLTAQLLGHAAQQRADSSTAEFARCLEREARAYETAGDGAAETAIPEEQHLVELRQKLAGTVARLRATAVGA